ncbi:MAG TPA: sulfotransferase domain-containing protein, partial [Rhizomicrobium sp.]|nr:sulfotransferase domain-containing protein [Rhizomicrobium sp.]
MRVGAASRKKLPLAFHEHKYEAMVEDFDAQIKAVCEFCGIEQNDAMHDFAKNAAKRDITSISAPQVRRGLYSEGVGQWRRYAKQMQPVMPVLEPWVKAFQYPKD